MKKITIYILLAMTVFVASCGQKQEKTGAQYNVAAISGYFAQGFGKKIVEGLDRAKADLPIDYKLIDTGTRSLDYQEQFNSVARTGSYDVILVMGWELVDALMNTASRYPDQKFVFIDGVLDNPNITYINFAEHEGSFVAGVLAASMIENTRSIGFVGGRDIPVIRNFLAGYEQGAKYVNPNITVKSLFAGTFDDPGRGKELALSLYNEGIKIVYSVAGPTGEGVLQAAKEVAGAYAIGVDLDQSPAAPESIPTSVVKNVDVGVYNLLKTLVDQEGVLVPSSTLLGLKENGVGIVRNESYSNLVPASVQSKVDEIEQKVAAGEITVTSVY
ncbi:MAG: BMP family lipoprotein [Brevinema sp.]